MYYVVHMVYQRHTMKMVVNDVNVKIHVAIIHAQKIQNVLSISPNMIHHLHQFAGNVGDFCYVLF